jgi:hypothetical protein
MEGAVGRTADVRENGIFRGKIARNRKSRQVNIAIGINCHVVSAIIRAAADISNVQQMRAGVIEFCNEGVPRH